MFEPIAGREFELKSVCQTGAVLLEIGKPEASGEDEWCCELRIRTPERVISRRYFGADSLQALVIGIKGAALELEMLRAAYGPAITVHGCDDLWVGLEFPSLDNVSK